MRAAALALVALIGASALAQERTPASAPLRLDKALSARSGYAFDYPRVLAQQRIFGLAHGAALLAAACRRTSHAAAADAYAAWRTRQARTISAAIADLSSYYFGDGIASWEELAQQMSLRDALPYASDSAELDAACASLAQALAQARYDFAARFRLEEFMAQLVAAAEIDARNTACRKQLAGRERKEFDERYQVWRDANATAAWTAAETLQREWPGEAPAATYAEWIARLRQETQARGDRAACLEFSAALAKPETALHSVFRMPPPPTAHDKH